MLYTESKLFDLGLSIFDINCLASLSNRYILISSKSAIFIKIKDLVTLAAPMVVTDIWIQLFNGLSEEATSIVICSNENKIMETLELDNVLDIFEIGNNAIITMKE